MERFGRRNCGGCRREVAACSLLMLTLLCLLQNAGALQLNARVLRLPGSNRNVVLGGVYHAFHGDMLKMFCYCQSNEFSDARRVELRRDESTLKAVEGCNTLTTIVNSTAESMGRYQCVATLANGTLTRVGAGELHVHDPEEIIHAPHHQYGLFNNTTSLNCSVQYNGTNYIRWINKTVDILGTFQVGLHHEGEYLCEANLGGLDLARNTSVWFTVIVPPHVTEQPMETLTFTSNERQSFVVNFQSKDVNETFISWYKDERSLQYSSPGHYIISNSVSNDSMSGRTNITFTTLRRSDKGQYRVVIENTHEIIPLHLRRTEANFTVDVSILPAPPSNLTTSVSATDAILSWSLPNRTSDEHADSQTVTLHAVEDDEVVMRKVVAGSSRQLQLSSLTPQQQYRVNIVAANQDGTTTSHYHDFSTPAGPPAVSEVSVRRSQERSNLLIVTAAVNYTGGGIIEIFRISYRKIGSSDSWLPLHRNFTAQAVVNESPFKWSADIQDDIFQGFGIELRVQAINSHGHASNSVEQREDIELPGAPVQVSVASSTYDSAVVNLVLSGVGTAPLTFVEAEFHGEEGRHVNTSLAAEVTTGGTINVTLTHLQDNTAYTVSFAVYNYGGKGVSSQHLNFTTVTRPPLPVYGIAVVAAGGIILLVAIVILILLLWKKWSIVKHKARRYSVSQAENNPLPSHHHIVKHAKGSPLSPLSATPPTPSTISTGLQSSSPGFYPTPTYCSASTSHLSRATPTGSLNPSHAPPSSFKFDAGSSRSNSENTDSDLETNSPRYTYTLPRSGEGTPQSSRSNGYDQVDMPLDDLEPVTLNSLLMRAHHTSHEPIRFGEAVHAHSRVSSASTSRSHKLTKGYMDRDSPQLRTQSCHSVATTQTCLSSDTTGTRDSLSYQPNSTAV